MALKFYGTMLCPDCVDAHKVLDESGTPYEFVDITGSIPALKEFMFLRDSNPAFDGAKAEQYLGIPALSPTMTQPPQLSTFKTLCKSSA